MSKWKFWLAAMIRSVVGGACNGLGALVVAPDKFNFEHPGKLMEMAGVGAFIAIVHYLQKSPLPDGVGDEYDAALKKSAERQTGIGN